MKESAFLKTATRALVCSFLVAGMGMALAQSPIDLIDTAKERGGWRFDNGKEFPGARGELAIASQRFRDKPVLSLRGDFTKGGNYVQAAVDLPDVPVDTLSFWVNVPSGIESLPIRLVDGSKQCHQIKLKINDKGGWQKISLPVDDFFGKMGTAAALDLADQYEKWGGANDGRWHQPGNLFVILNSRALGTETTILMGDVSLLPARSRTVVEKSIRLDDMLQLGEIDWEFNLGQEFAGAKGGLELVKDQPAPGQNAMCLHADFSGGGAYVGVRKSFASMAVRSMKTIRMKMRSETTRQFALRLVDGTGQCHQRKTMPFTPDGKWHDVLIDPTAIAGGEHWGGANDGKWHGTIRLVELMLNTRSSETKVADLVIGEIRATVEVEATAASAAYAESFESAKSIDANWQVRGNTRVDNPGSKGSLLLRRSLETLQTDTMARGEAFPVTAGLWQAKYAWKSDLHSPDNSYHASVALEVSNEAGIALETLPLGIGYGKHELTDMSVSVRIPPGASRARFLVKLQKTYGSFWIDELSASRLKIQPVEPRVERILIGSDVTGNLFMPDDAVAFHVTVEAVKPLTDAERTLRCSVRDYWGAALVQPVERVLGKQPLKKGRFAYAAEFALPSHQLETGRYCELHVEVPQGDADPVAEYCGFAVLPLAVTKQHAPEDVPFTIRNWDSRIKDYFYLADRLGLRMLGVWGGWEAKMPYKPSCPGIDICKELGAKWITGTPASRIERDGFKEYSEEALRTGMRNFLGAYADKGLAMIAMGNEPHGKGEKVLENVRAYRAIYETVKAFDPGIHVMGTSVEPNEEYFRAGYQDYLDSYDFHIYEHYTHVRRTMREYRELMKKHNAVKPIHSTELGLNSQGQTRLAVSREMIKKIASFFAEGGDTVSWFTIQYPDPKGKARGQFGDSHCMFDCKYNLYNPRLDAVTHYHLVNGICVKNFVAEKHYPDGEQAYLFRDAAGNCLQVLWLDGKRKDVFIPLTAKGSVRLVYIDGSEQTFRCANGGVTVTLNDDPILLHYSDGQRGVPDSLGAPSLSLEQIPAAVVPGGKVVVRLNGPFSDGDTLRVTCPPLWSASVGQGNGRSSVVSVQSPPSSAARMARIRIQTITDGKASGEIVVPVAVQAD